MASTLEERGVCEATKLNMDHSVISWISNEVFAGEHFLPYDVALIVGRLATSFQRGDPHHL